MELFQIPSPLQISNTSGDWMAALSPRAPAETQRAPNDGAAIGDCELPVPGLERDSRGVLLLEVALLVLHQGGPQVLDGLPASAQPKNTLLPPSPRFQLSHARTRSSILLLVGFCTCKLATPQKQTCKLA